MEAITPSVWFPVVTLVVGVFLKALFDSWTENRKVAFDRESRVEKRKEIILLQRVDLQRKALGELQVALSDLMRSVGRIQKHDARIYRETGIWGDEAAPESIGDVARDNFRSVTLVRVRVSDEDVRVSVSELSSLCSEVTLSDTERQSQIAWNAATVLYATINEKIGEALRALEREEQALLL